MRRREPKTKVGKRALFLFVLTVFLTFVFTLASAYGLLPIWFAGFGVLGWALGVALGVTVIIAESRARRKTHEASARGAARPPVQGEAWKGSGDGR